MALAPAVASVGAGEGVFEGFADGEGDADRMGVGDSGGVAEGVGVGPSAIAGVPKKDAARPTARSGGARKRCTCKALSEKSAA